MKPNIPLNERRNILTGILFLIFLLSIFTLDFEKGLIHSEGWSVATRFLLSLLNPDLSSDLLKLAFKSTLTTVSYALISLSIALLGGSILALFASGILFKSYLIQIIARAILGFLRAIHELIWAWFFVAAVGLNPIGAVFALAIPYSGYLGKIFADTLQQVPQPPLTTLQENGATPLQQLIYGYLPQAFPAMLSYTMYRLECAVRSSSVLSFIGLGGIGMQIQLSLQDLKYEQVWTFLIFLIGIIVIIDRWSYAVRKRIK